MMLCIWEMGWMYIDKRIEWIDVAKGIGILFIIP